MNILLFHFCISMFLFVITYMYINYAYSVEKNVNKDWQMMNGKYKNELKKVYFIKKHTDFILIRLTYLDNYFIKNSVQVEPIEGTENNRLKLTGRTELSPVGFVLILVFTFFLYIGPIYVYLFIKRVRNRTMSEMNHIADLSANV